MAIAILLGVLVLLGAGLVIALRTAAAARRELDDLEGEFADARGSLALDSDSDPEPWSSFDLAVLRDDVIVVEGLDPFDTLTEATSSARWHASRESNGSEEDAPDSWVASQDSDGSEHELDSWVASQDSNGSEHKLDSWVASQDSDGSEHELDSWLASQESYGSEHAPARWLASLESNGSEPTSTTDLAPVDDVAPVAWRAPADAPIIILVVGVGFLGTGMTAGVTTASRLRRAWGEVQESFAHARVITLDPDASRAASSAFDAGAAREGVSAAERRDPFPMQENGDSRVTWPPPRRNGLGPRPQAHAPGEPKPIEWRAPGGIGASR
jgi:hypothetical protein